MDWRLRESAGTPAIVQVGFGTSIAKVRVGAAGAMVFDTFGPMVDGVDRGLTSMREVNQ